jgi:hypothetical protein
MLTRREQRATEKPHGKPVDDVESLAAVTLGDDSDATARFQHSMNFVQRSLQIGPVVDRFHSGDYVECVRRERQIRNGAVPYIDTSRCNR